MEGRKLRAITPVQMREEIEVDQGLETHPLPGNLRAYALSR
jgi:hypothetical protein